jgi:hypothetical protein
LFDPRDSVFKSFALRHGTSDALFDFLLNDREVPETRKVRGKR